ncbi:hypothetical protein E2C01_088348 [Portunus trituberculatus]|uniref:Uncharacterized protein n=1 Tax=Portunus trituberculatus TaxID=210409 RepID=A0A5B7JF53_PORTR|nr:hypothetical protein [Portunus trituberculatus]
MVLNKVLASPTPPTPLSCSDTVLLVKKKNCWYSSIPEPLCIPRRAVVVRKQHSSVFCAKRRRAESPGLGAPVKIHSAISQEVKSRSWSAAERQQQ